jgi:hypothetical protein
VGQAAAGVERGFLPGEIAYQPSRDFWTRLGRRAWLWVADSGRVCVTETGDDQSDAFCSWSVRGKP